MTMNWRQSFAVLLGLSILGPALSACDSGPDRSQAIEAVEADSIRGHMMMLADDALEGREAGTRGYDAAARYVMQELEFLGVSPAGVNGGWTQPIDFLESRLVPESAVVELSGGDAPLMLKLRNDYIMGAGMGPEEESVTAPLVFVGYGIRAPENDMDDYAGVDVRGKILVMISGAPPHFATDQRAYYSSGRTKAALADELGAVGVITIRSEVDEERRPFERYLSGIGRPSMRWYQPDGSLFEGFPSLKGGATLSPDGARKLMAYAGRDVADIQAAIKENEDGEIAGTESFDLGISATLARRSTQRQAVSSNVLGVIEGSDPALKDEYIVYSAHLDHIGIRDAKGDDHIHNGAYDNAAGVSALLEIAKAVKKLPVAPRRSILFAFVTAEEKGLLGSAYFAQNPTVPADSLVANVNIDMPYLGLPVADVVPIGAEHSTIMEAVEQATSMLDMETTPDPMPEQVRFVRSDQFRFVQAGIPAVAFKAGSKSSDKGIDGERRLEVFLKDHYHTPSDDLDLPFNIEGAERFVRAGLLTGLILADAEERTRWLEGDFFGDMYGTPATKAASD